MNDEVTGVTFLQRLVQHAFINCVITNTMAIADSTGMCALHEAVLSGNLECVMLLVKYGADIQQEDEEGWTPLHMACSDSYPHIAK